MKLRACCSARPRFRPLRVHVQWSQHGLSARVSFPQRRASAPLSEIVCPHVWGLVSGLSVLFRWSPCPFFFASTVLIAVPFSQVLESRGAMPLFFGIGFPCQDPLKFHVNFKMGFAVSVGFCWGLCGICSHWGAVLTPWHQGFQSVDAERAPAYLYLVPFLPVAVGGSWWESFPALAKLASKFCVALGAAVSLIWGILFSDYLLLVYRNAASCTVLASSPGTLLNSFIRCNSSSAESSHFLRTRPCRLPINNFYPSLSDLDAIYLFPSLLACYLTVTGRIPEVKLEVGEGTGSPCPVPAPGRAAPACHPCTAAAVGFSVWLLLCEGLPLCSCPERFQGSVVNCQTPFLRRWR